MFSDDSPFKLLAKRTTWKSYQVACRVVSTSNLGVSQPFLKPPNAMFSVEYYILLHNANGIVVTW